jgi:FdhD protein
LAEEAALTVYLNGEELVTLLCTPQHQDELAVGFLVLQGLLKDPEELAAVEVEADRGLVWVKTRVDRPLTRQTMFKRVITSGCGRGVTFQFLNEAQLPNLAGVGGPFSAPALLELMHRFQHASELYRLTGGVHSAALASEQGILVFREDIGRHNAVDKIAGHCFMNRVSTADKLLLTTGRVSSEILTKAVRLGVPCLVSRSAPTNVAVSFAEELGITLIGFARGRRLTVFTHRERLTGFRNAWASPSEGG